MYARMHSQTPKFDTYFCMIVSVLRLSQ